MGESIDPKYAPNELAVMAWFGYTNILEKKYQKHKIAIDKLASFYQQNDIRMVLLITSFYHGGNVYGITLCSIED